MRYIVLLLLFVSGLFWFCMAMICALVQDASTYAELNWFGKISVWLLSLSVGASFLISLIMPFAGLLYNKIKTWF